MKLTGEEARNIVYEDNDDWNVIEENIVDTSRWSIIKESVCLHLPTNKYYMFKYSIGATEEQDERPFEYEDVVEPIEVQQIEKVVKAWKIITNK